MAKRRRNVGARKRASRRLKALYGRQRKMSRELQSAWDKQGRGPWTPIKFYDPRKYRRNVGARKRASRRVKMLRKSGRKYVRQFQSKMGFLPSRGTYIHRHGYTYKGRPRRRLTTGRVQRRNPKKEVTSGQFYGGINKRFKQRAALLKRFGFSYFPVEVKRGDDYPKLGTLAVFELNRFIIPASEVLLADSRAWAFQLAEISRRGLHTRWHRR